MWFVGGGHNSEQQTVFKQRQQNWTSLLELHHVGGAFIDGKIELASCTNAALKSILS